jgi:hypothetical protein
MPTTMHSKNKNYYSHCPLKKRPVFIVKEGIYCRLMKIYYKFALSRARVC